MSAATTEEPISKAALASDVSVLFNILSPYVFCQIMLLKKKSVSSLKKDQSSGSDMQVKSIEAAVKATCETIAEDPSWLESLQYD